MNPTSIELPAVYYASIADQGGLRPKPTLENDRNWPTAATKGSDFHAQIMAAFRPGPEPESIDRALAAEDPKLNKRPFLTILAVGRCCSG
jgi:hypothetical protein